MKGTMKMKELWFKKKNAKIDCADDVVILIDESPLAIHATGNSDTYVFGRFEFFENFTRNLEIT